MAPDGAAEALLAAAPYFDLGESEASKVIRDILAATEGWRGVAAHHGVPDAEIDRFATSLDMARDRLRRIVE